MRCPRLRRQFYQIKHTRHENELGSLFGEAGPDRCLRVGLNKARYRRLPAGLRRFSISSERRPGQAVSPALGLLKAVCSWEGLPHA